MRLLKCYNRIYYTQGIRWIFCTKKGKPVYCIECGNYANGALVRIVFKLRFNIPYCKSHLSDIFFSMNPEINTLTFPCFVNYRRTERNRPVLKKYKKEED